MERLTAHSKYSGTPEPNLKTIGDVCMKMSFCDDYDACEDCPIRKIIDRLCEYEDSDLTPKEILLLKERVRTPKVATSVFDKQTILKDCTVQILENSVTGEVSIGWWKNT